MKLVKTKDKQWEIRQNGFLIEFKLRGNNVDFEVGPEAATARAHEGNGGTQNLKESLEKPYPWIYDYPGLHNLICAELRQEIKT